MPLDLVILGPNGMPAHEVRIGSDEHAHLMKLIKAQVPGSIVERIADYYADAEFSPSEARALATDLRGLLGCAGDPVEDLIASIIRLTDMAVEEQLPILAIAD